MKAIQIGVNIYLKTRTKILIGAVCIVAVLLAWFLSVPITNSVLLPKSMQHGEINLNDYHSMEMEPYSNLVASKFGVKEIDKRINLRDYLYSICGNSANNEVVCDVLLRRYYVKNDFEILNINEIAANQIEEIRVSSILSPEIRLKYGMLKYEYDESAQVSNSMAKQITNTLFSANLDNPESVPLNSIENMKYVRCYLNNSPIFLNVGILFEYNEKTYISVGNVNTNNEITDCVMVVD